jgi:hypothetical protein
MAEFIQLRVDPASVRGRKLFRLAGNPSFILVAEDVKKTIDALPLINLRASSPDDRASY